MTTKLYKKVEPKLSEEIKRYSKIIKEGIKNIDFPIFLAEIPYNGFKILLQHNIAPKSQEHFYYARSKYGWWQYCAKKDELDAWDKKLLKEKASHYGQYVQDDHSFCNDNQHEGEFYSGLQPNAMVEDIKQQINMYLRDKEIEIARSKMTEEDYQRIAERAKAFLDNVVTENKEVVFRLSKKESIEGLSKIAPKGMEITKSMMSRGFYEGWIIVGKDNNYFMDETGKSYYYNPTGQNHLQPICVMSKGGSKWNHLYDHIASRILALINDNKTKKDINTLR